MHWRRRSFALWLTINAETTGFGVSGIAGELSTPEHARRAGGASRPVK
jgi:hypothetical protein